MYGTIPKAIALSIHATRKCCNVAVRDAATKELLFINGLREVGLWLSANKFHYVLGTQAKWLRG